MGQIKTVEVHDKVFEETYTAYIQRNGTNWMYWIPDVPKDKCEEPTEKVLLKTLETKFHEALVAEEDEWERKFESDVKAGKLDDLHEKALDDSGQGDSSAYKSSAESLGYVHKTAPRIWECYQGLPPAVQRLADKQFEWQLEQINMPSVFTR